MLNRDGKLVVLTSSTSEFAANIVAAALREQGIAAQVAGGGLAGMRAEAPAEAQVLVFHHDLLRARLALRALQADSVDIDWDDVDVGKGEE